MNSTKPGLLTLIDQFKNLTPIIEALSKIDGVIVFPDSLIKKIDEIRNEYTKNVNHTSTNNFFVN